MSEQPILSVNTIEIPAQGIRALLDGPLGEGAMSAYDMRVSASSGLAVSVAAGVCFVRGDSVPDQGLYRCRNDSPLASTSFDGGGIPTAHGTLPRLDQIVAHVYDEDALDLNMREWRLEVLPGEATSGATLDNRSGAAALPDSVMRLADVMVGAGSSSLSAANLRDRRPMAMATLPPLLIATDAVTFDPIGGVTLQPNFSDSNHDNMQAAAAMVLPRRIENVTKIHVGWFDQLAGNYAIGIYDASGRKIQSAIQAFGGAKNHTILIPATTFEGGVYYVAIGINSTGGGDAAPFFGTKDKGVPNAFLSSTTGGTTLPDTLLGFDDDIGLPVPIPTLAA